MVVMNRSLAFAFAVAGVLLDATAGAAPQVLTYQGSVQLPSGGPPLDGIYRTRFKLYDAPVDGTNQWQETKDVEVQGGLFSTVLGDITPFNDLFSLNSELWLEIVMDVDLSMGLDGDEIFSPRQRLASSAWALEAERLQGMAASEFQQRVTGAAPPGQYITAINADGTVVTAPDQVGTGVGGGITGVLPGEGLVGGGTTGTVVLSADTNVLQRRVTGAAGAQQYIRAINADGSVLTGSDVDTVDGMHATDFADAGHTHQGTDVVSPVAQATNAGNADTVDGLHAADLLDKATYDPGSDGVVNAADFATSASDSDTVDGQHASDFALAGHDHFGETWNGAGTGLRIESTGIGGIPAIEGIRIGGSANPVGVYGESDSSSGRGVFGKTTDATGATAGVRGESLSTNSNATGVFGILMDAAATGAGVKGQNNGTNGYGVWGQGGNGAVGVLGQTNSSTKYGVWAYNSSSGVALRAEGAGNLIEAWSLSPVNARFRVDNNGNVTADGTFTSPAADFAELLPAEDGLEPGDVLAIGSDGNLTRTTKARQRSVVGVYSTKPAFLGGVDPNQGSSKKIPLAVVGIVPVKVTTENGPISTGDLLVASSTPGHAMSAGHTAETGTVIGKAMTGIESGTGVIKMLVMLQ